MSTTFLLSSLSIENEKPYRVEIIPEEKQSITKHPSVTQQVVATTAITATAITATAVTAAAVTATEFTNCCDKQCNTLAREYLNYIRSTTTYQKQIMMACNTRLLSTVQGSIELIQAHRLRQTSWLPHLLKELCQLGKLIKDASVEVDRVIPFSSLYSIEERIASSSSSSSSCPSIYEAYGRAIRISIYYGRAVLYYNDDKFIYYCHKCISVHPPPTHIDTSTQRLQQMALKYLTTTHKRPKLPSRTSSFSSFMSLSTTCSNCGVEKKGMPVCSKCKVQSYCSLQCLKAHKPIHTLECLK
ncbi:uncharacterized protein BX663DRAFT_527802 [Cokeromyces recurvatus]|uniref:uncharacterized protein n=1 Tax=Cokeromyces recurvatus TaxID=90255 RepID=UPI00221F29C5|nr:uncharacterized protein BX663DRAFT_527802 [Cokeromyces recurvatus]KAI7897551.1 hypothetical protein BX663DRAFT_527802 [Cokeromyces recurvatus]